MANISSAEGVMTISKTFFEQYKEEFFEKFTENVEYGIFFYGDASVKDNEAILNFYGLGRWNFSNTISRAYAWNKSEEFSKALKKECPTFHLKYTDFEPGMGLLYNEEDDVTFFETEEGKLGVSLTCTRIESIELTDFNRITYGFEEGYLVEDLCKLSKRELDIFMEIKDSLHETYHLSFKDMESFIQIFYDFAREDEDLNGGICLFRLEDFLDYMGDDFVDWYKSRA